MALTNCTGDTYIEFIDATECIGNSLEKINSNFGLVDSALCEISTLFNAMGSISGIVWSNGDSTFREAIRGTNSTADYFKPGDTLDDLNVKNGINCQGPMTAAGDFTTLGNIYARQDIVAFSTSDERLKKDIRPITNALSKLQDIKGVTFEWDGDLQKTYTGKDVGVLAQDIQRVQPECVVERDTGYLAVKYDKLIPLLIESIKELKSEVNDLRRQLSSRL